MVHPTKDKAIKNISSWIEVRYNHVCLHPVLGYRTPNEVKRESIRLNEGSLNQE